MKIHRRLGKRSWIASVRLRNAGQGIGAAALAELSRNAFEFLSYEAAENARIELEKVKKTVSYNTVQRMGKRLDEVYYQATANKVAFLYDTIEKALREIIVELQELASLAPEPHTMYTEKLANLLLNYVMPVLRSEKKEEGEEIVINVKS